jgi:acyl-CoA thioester hydrolase
MAISTPLTSPPILNLRIDWSDLDLYGHVNNVAFMKYVQAARLNYIELLGLNAAYESERKSFLVASTTIHFLSPLYFPGQLTIHSKITFIKNSSFGIAYEIINDQLLKVAEASDILVLFDFKNNQKIAFPVATRNLVNHIQQSTF